MEILLYIIAFLSIFSVKAMQNQTYLCLLNPEIAANIVASAALNSNNYTFKDSNSLTPEELNQLTNFDNGFAKNFTECMQATNSLAQIEESFLKSDRFHDALFEKLNKFFSERSQHLAGLSFYARYKANQFTKEFINFLHTFFICLEEWLKNLEKVKISPETLKLLPATESKLELRPIQTLYDFLVLAPEEFEAHVGARGKEYYTDLYQMAQFENILRSKVHELQSKTHTFNFENTDLITDTIRRILTIFYAHFNACKNMISLWVWGPDLHKAITVFDKYAVDSFHINAYLPTKKALNATQELLSKSTFCSLLNLLALIAIQTENRDLATLIIEREAQDKYLQPKISYPILSLMYSADKDHGFLKRVLSLAQQLKKDTITKLLQNSFVRLSYYGLPICSLSLPFDYNQFKVAQQEGWSSKSSGYYAIAHALVLVKGLGKKNEKELEADLMLSQPNERLRELVAFNRRMNLVTDYLSDLLLLRLKNAEKIPKDVEISKTAVILPLRLQDAVVQIKKKQNKNYSKSRTNKNPLPSSQSNALHTRIIASIPQVARYLAFTTCENEQAIKVEWSNKSDEPDKTKYFETVFDTSHPLEFSIKCDKNELIIEPVSASDHSYKQTFGPCIDPNSTFTGKIPKLLTSAQRKEVLLASCAEKGLYIGNSTESYCISYLFFESLVRATHGWNKENLIGLIDKASAAFHCHTAEEIMHHDEPPLNFGKFFVDWKKSTVSTTLDKHLYAQWKKGEEEMRQAKLMTEQADITVTSSDWLLPLEITNCMDFEVRKETCCCTIIACLTHEGALLEYTDKKCIPATMSALFPKLGSDNAIVLFIERANHWFVCVFKKIANRIHMRVADSLNCERRFESALTKLLYEKIGIDDQTTT